jgi:peptidoglycan/LPS O-acetylase OafA/YrhL
MVRSRVLGFFGYISYGLYLLHVLIFDSLDHLSIRQYLPGFGHDAFTDLFIRLAYFGCVATVIAWLSRKYFEGFFLKRKPMRQESIH